MWDLNGSPDRRYDQQDCSSPMDAAGRRGNDDDELDAKGKRVGSVSNSSSSAVVIEDDGSEEEEEEELDDDYQRGIARKRSSPGSSRLFGFSMTDNSSWDSDPPVTRQFFPVDDSELGTQNSTGGTSTSTAFPTAHWVGVKFCHQSSEASGLAGLILRPDQKGGGGEGTKVGGRREGSSGGRGEGRRWWEGIEDARVLF